MATDPSTIINSAAELGAAYQQQMGSLASQAISAASGSSNLPVWPVSAPRLPREVPNFQGEVNITSELQAGYDGALSSLVPAMHNAIADYIARWFPACVFATTEDWICNTILYGGTGLPANIENAIWQRGRARDVIEANRLKQEAFTTLADRGFSQPTGAVAMKAYMVQQEASNKISQFNRDTAIKAAEIEIENIKFAVEQGVKIRIAVMNGLGDYIRAWFTPYATAVDMAKARADAKGKFVNSAADYYRAIIAEAELQLKADEFTANAYNTVGTAQGNVWMEQRKLLAGVTKDIALFYGNAAVGAAGQVLAQAGDATIRIGTAE